MKTTVEIPDAVLDEARGIAASEGTTLRALIETGLRKEIQERKRRDAYTYTRRLTDLYIAEGLE
ncbi:MAG: type II toxin-antitoxin system VapB family antitoxin [Acidobacteriota bacterium]|nr:type II toxin-antitoxin system VapB family antitoxin [Acidobacteriota bacterium]MDQ5871608.1 type II toxin-antitoxin system VapB family antitoxin [Acidobacteriota bacterium]